ncbi:MAG: hypothetical protein ACOYBT_09985 [Polynucleobacter sp.]
MRLAFTGEPFCVLGGWLVSEPKVGPNRGNAGKGRPKGSPNKQTAAVKDMILTALDKKGGVDYLARQADENPAAFLTLVGKVLPMQVQGAGENGEHLHEVAWRVYGKPAD